MTSPGACPTSCSPAVLLAGTGLLLELAVRKPGNFVYRAVAAAIGVAASCSARQTTRPASCSSACLLIVGTVALAARTALR